MNGFILTNPTDISNYRLLALKHMLKLEMLGIRFGKSVYGQIKQEFNLSGTRQQVYEQYCTILNERIPQLKPHT